MIGKPLVLIVEDEPLIRELMALEFADAGYAVRAEEDGVTAVATIESGVEFDALVTDILLPGSIDGYSVAEAARRVRPAVPVIYATAYSPEPVRAVSGSRVFSKPVSPATMVAALRDLGVAPAA